MGNQWSQIVSRQGNGIFFAQYKDIRFDPFDCAQALFFKGGIKARSG